MEKIWKDGRIIIELSEEDKEKVDSVLKKDVPSNKEIVELLKLIIEILTS
ncbi:MAG: hypothetical protein ACTSQA_03030 [Candidatus Heimdallarchaeaceae archaeon]